jgi:hypothetical protein
LQDNLANFSGTLGELGVEDSDPKIDGIQINPNDMQEIIRQIMDCDDPEISRKILVEIMADISKSKIGGLPLKNYNHKPIEGASVVADAERQKNVDAMYDRLQDTTTGAQEQLQKDLKGKTKEQVAAYFNITVEDAQKLRYNKGGFVDINSFMNNSGREKYNPGTNGAKTNGGE